MSVNEREKIHYELLEALYKARKEVEYLEAALAHNAAFLGTGVEREDQPRPPDDPRAVPETVLRYLGLAGPEEDISDYIGREGDDASRPRLGPDAPDDIRPTTAPRIGRLVGLLASAHPDDRLVLPGSGPGPDKTPPPPENGAAEEKTAAPKTNDRADAFATAPGRTSPNSLDILVAEDDAVNRFALRTLLRRAGHRCVCVEDGRQALEALLLRPFDCLISDMRMPVMDGPELIRRIRAGDDAGIEAGPQVLALMDFDTRSRPVARPLYRDIPIIVLSGSSRNEDKLALATKSVTHFLEKPLDAGTLAALLKDVRIASAPPPRPA